MNAVARDRGGVLFFDDDHCGVRELTATTLDVGKSTRGLGWAAIHVAGRSLEVFVAANDVA